MNGKEVCRMRIRWFRLVTLSTFLSLVTASVASAHVKVLPEVVPADSFEVLTVRVPTEEDIPTTQVRVEVPEGFTVLGVQPVPGWDHEFEENAGVIDAIIWSGGEIGPQEFQEFAVQARTPEDTGEFAWNAFQTYEDGSVVGWTGSEDAEEPASVVRVGAGADEADEPGNATEEAGSRNPASTGGLVPIAAYGGLGALALIVALVALVRANK
jgi:uncharacterized protein YcnI